MSVMSQPRVAPSRDVFDAGRLVTGDARLSEDTGGAALVEFAIAMVPVFIFFFGMMQMSAVAYIHLMVKHAAVVAARCEAVVHPGGTGNWATDAGPESDVKDSVYSIFQGVVTGVQESDFDVTTTSSAVTSQKGTPTNDVVGVVLTYKCTVPLGNVIGCGPSMKIPISAQAAFPNQGSVYQTIWNTGS